MIKTAFIHIIFVQNYNQKITHFADYLGTPDIQEKFVIFIEFIFA